MDKAPSYMLWDLSIGNISDAAHDFSVFLTIQEIMWQTCRLNISYNCPHAPGLHIWASPCLW